MKKFWKSLLDNTEKTKSTIELSATRRDRLWFWFCCLGSLVVLYIEHPIGSKLPASTITWSDWIAIAFSYISFFIGAVLIIMVAIGFIIILFKKLFKRTNREDTGMDTEELNHLRFEVADAHVDL